MRAMRRFDHGGDEKSGDDSAIGDASNDLGMLRAGSDPNPGQTPPRRHDDASLTCYDVMMMSY